MRGGTRESAAVSLLRCRRCVLCAVARSVLTLLCPPTRTLPLLLPLPAEARYLSDVGRSTISKYRPQLLGAADALDALLAPAQCPALVAAIVQVGPGWGWRKEGRKGKGGGSIQQRCLRLRGPAG